MSELKTYIDQKKSGKKLEMLQLHFSPESLQILPDPFLRHILFAAILEELGIQDEKELKETPVQLQKEFLCHRSKILCIIRKPYRPVFMADMIERFRKMATQEDTMERLLKDMIENQPSLNSTLRNLFIAYLLNQTIFKNSHYKAEICLAQYTWRKLIAKIYREFSGELPEGTTDKEYIKFLISVEKNGKTVQYLDYGQSGDLKSGVSQTGEGIENVVGNPSQISFDASDINEVITGLLSVAGSQDKEADREAVKQLGMNLEMIRKIEDRRSWRS